MIHCYIALLFYMSIISLTLIIGRCFEYKNLDYLLIKKTNVAWFFSVLNVHVLVEKQILIATSCRGFLLHFVSFPFFSISVHTYELCMAR